MSRRLEGVTVKGRSSCRIKVEESIVVRGLREFAPRKTPYPKLAASVVRHLAPARRDDLADALVMMPMAGDDADLTLELLRDVRGLRLAPPSYPALVNSLIETRTSRVVVVMDEVEPRTEDAQARFAKSLVAHDPKGEATLASGLALAAREGDARREEADGTLVVDERVGKAYVLSPEAASRKQSLKRLLAVRSRASASANRSPLVALPGWAVAGMRISRVDSKEESVGAVNLAVLDLVFDRVSIGLDMAQSVKAVASDWLGELGVSRPYDVTISCPWLSISAFLSEAFLGLGRTDQIANPGLRHPDHIYGWQPHATFVDVLRSAASPALYIYTGRYPAVHLAAVWP